MRGVGFVAVLLLSAIARGRGRVQCASGAGEVLEGCQAPSEYLEEDDVSLLSLTTQVHTRSHSKEPLPPEQASAPMPAEAARARPQQRKRAAAEAAPAQAAEDYDSEEVDDDAAARGQAAEEQPTAEEQLPPGSGEKVAAAPAAAGQALRRRPRHKRAPAAPEPAVRAEPPAEAPAEDQVAEELAPEEGEEPGAAWAGTEVYSVTHRRKHAAAQIVTQTPEPRPPVEAAAEVLASTPAVLPQQPLPPPNRLGEAGGLKALSGGMVEAPLPLLIVGVVCLAGLGAFLLHEISERLRERQKPPPPPDAAPPARPQAMGATSPLQGGSIDTSFLFHVLNSVESGKHHRRPNTAELLSKGPPPKVEEDSSDDCSDCPRPEKEPESEFDECEEVLGKLREADWALQIAYYEALQRRNENPTPSGRHQASQPRSSSRRQTKDMQALGGDER